MKMKQSMGQFETAFERQKALEQERREQLRKRAITRSRFRQVTRHQQNAKVRFAVLAVCLTITVIVVTVAMFEALTLVAG